MKKPSYSLVIPLLFASLECLSQSIFHGYNIDRPSKVIKLPTIVNEISGIAYKNESVYAIDDEHGNLYKIELKSEPNIQHWSFGENNDYEDIILANHKLYTLSSSGHLVEFDEKFPIGKMHKKELENKGRNEYESLYYDPAIEKIVVLCKDCSEDKKDKNTAWSYDLSSQSFDKKPVYVIEQKQIENVLGKKIARFKPSAATINPLTKEVFVLSSINKLLVIMKDNIVTDAIELTSDLYKQPEGITFSPSGELLISNESAGKGSATILMFDKKQ